MSVFDNHLDELSNKANKEYENLKNCVEDIIVKTGVVNIYPEGKEKELAKCLAEDSKKELVKFMINYEQARNEYINYLNANKAEFSNYVNYIRLYPETYICIEKIYKEFYKR